MLNKYKEDLLKKQQQKEDEAEEARVSHVIQNDFKFNTVDHMYFFMLNFTCFNSYEGKNSLKR